MIYFSLKVVVSEKYKVEQEKGPLTLTEIISCLEYKTESEVCTGFFLLLLYTFSPPPPPPINSPPYHNISQYDQVEQLQLLISVMATTRYKVQ